jgi:hypothetical protein
MPNLSFLGTKYGPCPVCGGTIKLVIHHDHFGEWCTNVIRAHWKQVDPSDDSEQRCRWLAINRVDLYSDSYYDPDYKGRYEKELQPDRPTWHTFPPTWICSNCNGICAAIKRSFSWLPKFVSFTPAEMAILRTDGFKLDVVKRIWVRKKEED